MMMRSTNWNSPRETRAERADDDGVVELVDAELVLHQPDEAAGTRRRTARAGSLVAAAVEHAGEADADQRQQRRRRTMKTISVLVRDLQLRARAPARARAPSRFHSGWSNERRRAGR